MSFVSFFGHAQYVNPQSLCVSCPDLGNAIADDLQELSAPCQKATFGVGQTDTLDEAYRKAGKMIFCASGRRQNTAADNCVRAEIYKLNVYGPGSFFKAHQDTPHRENMIGSLVVIFPTAHAGGALTLEHDGTA
ncbi:hypothetical protein C8J57DRAFT_1394819 [Mycena rebaudengoi]|nr:hypothetical protein C8J57DRAFT_1394819 [Mycena rebaudengoi]